MNKEVIVFELNMKLVSVDNGAHHVRIMETKPDWQWHPKSEASIRPLPIRTIDLPIETICGKHYAFISGREHVTATSNLISNLAGIAGGLREKVERLEAEVTESRIELDKLRRVATDLMIAKICAEKRDE